MGYACHYSWSKSYRSAALETDFANSMPGFRKRKALTSSASTRRRDHFTQGTTVGGRAKCSERNSLAPGFVTEYWDEDE
jgi:hypothetical protein